MELEANIISDFKAVQRTSPEAIHRARQYYEETLQDYYKYLSVGVHSGMHHGYCDDASMSKAESVLRMNAVLADYANVSEGNRVLDAGCGVGGSSLWLSENRGVHTVGVTITPGQCDIAREKASSKGLEKKSTFLVADYCDTGLEANSFDVVWANESLCHSDNKTAFMKEAFRLLKPGGRLLIADGFINRHPRNPIETKFIDYWQHAWALSLDSTEEVSRKAQISGFESVKFEDITDKVLPYASFIFRVALKGCIPAFIKFSLGNYSKSRLKNGLGTLAYYPALEWQLWRYAILVATKPTA